MKKYFLLIVMLFTLGVSCSRETLVLPDIVLNQVTDIKTYSLDRKIRVVFRAYNNETGFIGYNIFVGTQAGVVPSSQIVLDSTTVSVPLYYSDPNTIYSIDLTNNSSTARLVNGKKYYITICAENYQNSKYKAGPSSPEFACTPLTNYLFNLYDHKAATPTNVGFKLLFAGTPVMSDLADGVYIEVRSNGIVPSLYLCVSNSAMYIQDLGSAAGIELKNPVPTYPNGYVGPQAASLVLSGHVYAFYDFISKYYGKIFTPTVPGPVVFGSSATVLQIQVVVHPFPDDVKF